ncbi:MAG: hypothetical protein AB7O38_08915, partial [Pirellulaceae bacterium]
PRRQSAISAFPDLVRPRLDVPVLGRRAGPIAGRGNPGGHRPTDAWLTFSQGQVIESARGSESLPQRPLRSLSETGA